MYAIEEPTLDFEDILEVRDIYKDYNFGEFFNNQFNTSSRRHDNSFKKS